MLDLKGKWVLITGASRGIGNLAARAMAEQGCNLILQSRSVEHTAALKEELMATGVICHSVEADLNDIPSVMKMLESIDSLGMDVDIVLNNAGLPGASRLPHSSIHPLSISLDIIESEDTPRTDSTCARVTGWL